MLASYQKSPRATLLFVFLLLTPTLFAQSGSSSSVIGTVADESGAVVPNATVEIRNAVSGFERTTITDGSGNWVTRLRG